MQIGYELWTYEFVWMIYTDLNDVTVFKFVWGFNGDFCTVEHAKGTSTGRWIVLLPKRVWRAIMWGNKALRNEGIKNFNFWLVKIRLKEVNLR